MSHIRFVGNRMLIPYTWMQVNVRVAFCLGAVLGLYAGLQLSILWPH